MAKPGRSTIRKEIKFDYPWPKDLKYKRVNLRTRADDLGQRIIEVGFTGQTGATVSRRGKTTSNYEKVEEWFDVATPVLDTNGQVIGYTGGSVADAKKVVEEFVIPRVSELFADSEDVYPEVMEEDIPDDALAPSVAPLGSAGEPVFRGKKAKAQ